MMEEYTVTGGLRWGESSWFAGNVTWPFATQGVNSERLWIRVRVWKLWQKFFEFTRLELKDIRKHQGFISEGVVIEHSNGKYPPFILFWTFNYRELKSELNRLGYRVLERK
jgi:hypothetical protein